jgi:hypothetical protein
LGISAGKLAETLFEIILKQVQIILNIDNLSDMSELLIMTEQQSCYAKQIDGVSDDKRRLYERYVLKEINADEYKASKATLDAELLRLTQFHDTVSKETAKLAETKSAENENRKH